jgi:phosphonate transport system substrate-binding protein
MTKRLGAPCDIELSIFRTYDDGIDALVNGTVDFVHCGPASYIPAKERNAGIELLVMEHEKGEKLSKGVIIVKKDSPIKSLEDLRGKSFAFGDKNSTVGRYLVQAQLVEHGVYASDLSAYKYLDRHDQVASAVEHGDFDAGAVKFTSFQKANEKNTLRALATFDNVTKPIVARVGLDRNVFEALRASLMEFKNDAFFKDMKISGFTTAADDDFDFVRRGIAKADDFERKKTGN